MKTIQSRNKDKGKSQELVVELNNNLNIECVQTLLEPAA